MTFDGPYSPFVIVLHYLPPKKDPKDTGLYSSLQQYSSSTCCCKNLPTYLLLGTWYSYLRNLYQVPVLITYSYLQKRRASSFLASSIIHSPRLHTTKLLIIQQHFSIFSKRYTVQGTVEHH